MVPELVVEPPNFDTVLDFMEKVRAMLFAMLVALVQWLGSRCRRNGRAHHPVVARG